MDRAPDEPVAHYALATALSLNGHEREAVEEYRQACALNPNPPAAWHDRLALSQAQTGDLEGAIAMGVRGDFAAAVPIFQKAVELSDSRDWRCLDMLASAYDRVGRSSEAVQAERKALDLAIQQHDEQLQKQLGNNLQRYERDGAKMR